MPHKFKVGEVVNYRPVDRYLRHLRGAYTIVRLLPGTAGQPEYRIRRAFTLLGFSGCSV